MAEADQAAGGTSLLICTQEGTALMDPPHVVLRLQMQESAKSTAKGFFSKLM